MITITQTFDRDDPIFTTLTQRFEGVADDDLDLAFDGAFTGGDGGIDVVPVPGTATATGVEFVSDEDPDFTVRFSGTGLTYDQAGVPDGGQLDTIEIDFDGFTILTLDDLPFTATEFFNALAQDRQFPEADPLQTALLLNAQDYVYNATATDGGVVVEELPGDDQLRGGSGDDVLGGGEGDDFIVGFGGDDTLRGGDGFDSFGFFAGWGDDTIEDPDDDGILIFDGIAEADVTQTEVGDDLVISDGENSVTFLGYAANDYDYDIVFEPGEEDGDDLPGDDFDGEGAADIAFRGPGGAAGYWAFEDDADGGYAYVGVTGASDTAYEIVGFADITDDGAQDFLLYNGATGDTGIWDVSGGTAAWQRIAFVDPASGYAIAGTGDFDGNGTDDVLWRNQSTGDTGYWAFGDAGDPTDFAWTRAGAPSSDWTVEATGDLNGDGTTDVVWRNGTVVGFWDMDGGTPEWKVLGRNVTENYAVVDAADLDGDGDDDLLLANEAGGVAQFEIENEVVSFSFIGTAGGSFDIVDTADIDADGAAEIVFQNDGGFVGVFNVGGAPFYEGIGSAGAFEVRGGLEDDLFA